MASIYDRIDCRWSYAGDYLPGEDGDFADSAVDQIQSLVDMIMTVVQADVNDWQEHPTLAASLSDFVGQPNTRKTGEDIKTRIIVSLVSNGIVRADDLTVKVVPIDSHSVLSIISVAAIPTTNNSLRTGEVLNIPIVFDVAERSITLLDRRGRGGFFGDR